MNFIHSIPNHLSTANQRVVETWQHPPTMERVKEIAINVFKFLVRMSFTCVLTTWVFAHLPTTTFFFCVFTIAVCLAANERTKENERIIGERILSGEPLSYDEQTSIERQQFVFNLNTNIFAGALIGYEISELLDSFFLGMHFPPNYGFLFTISAIGYVLMNKESWSSKLQEMQNNHRLQTIKNWLSQDKDILENEALLVQILKQTNSQAFNLVYELTQRQISDPDVCKATNSYIEKRREWLFNAALELLKNESNLDGYDWFQPICRIAVIRELSAPQLLTNKEHYPPIFYKHLIQINGLRESFQKLSEDQKARLSKSCLATEETAPVDPDIAEVHQRVTAIAYPLQTRCAPLFQDMVSQAKWQHAMRTFNLIAFFHQQWELLKQWKEDLFYRLPKE